MRRGFFFLILTIIIFTMPWWIYALAVLLYALNYDAYEIIPLGALADAFFGIAAYPIFYTLLSGVIFLVIESIKPLLSFYEEPA